MSKFDVLYFGKYQNGKVVWLENPIFDEGEDLAVVRTSDLAKLVISGYNLNLSHSPLEYSNFESFPEPIVVGIRVRKRDNKEVLKEEERKFYYSDILLRRDGREVLVRYRLPEDILREEEENEDII